MKAVLAGAGAIGQQHLDAIQTIGGIEVVSLVVRDLEATRAAAGKHVQVEIPLADSSSGAEAVTRMPQRTGLVCMVDHTRRFNPSPQWVHQRIARGESKIQQLDVQAYFFRRTNMNALGQPRS